MIREIEELFQRQARNWPQFAMGMEGLARARMRRVRIDWFEVFIRHIPHRAPSTTAAVDRESVSKRPCFLCAANLPAQEEGLPFDGDFTLYCNPFPIVDRHLTIVHKEHSPQRIAGRFGQMLDLAAALPGYFVVYNGPECGASAPDHMHFQAGSRVVFPIEHDTARRRGVALPGYGRNVFVFCGDDRSALTDRLQCAIDLLAQATGKPAEPMLNIAVFHDVNGWTAYLFPRSKHRPGVFYTGELTVSPASIDLCGIFVVPMPKDFEKISGADIAAIFREVTLPDDLFQELAAKMGEER